MLSMNMFVQMKTFKNVFIIVFIWFYFLVLYLVCGWAVEHVSELRPLSRSTNGFLFEPIVLFLHFLIISILTKRVKIPILIVSLFYMLFIFINIEMMKIFGMIFSPSDVKHSVQVLFAFEALASYWVELLIVFMSILGLAVLLIRSKPIVFFHRHYIKLVTVLVISTVMMITLKSSIAEGIRYSFKLPGQAVPKVFAEKHGFLFSFYYQLLKFQPVKKPVNYSKSAIEEIIKKYQKQSRQTNAEKPDVIIFFIESFADPNQVGIKTNRDPIPNFRKFSQESQSGLVVSPEIGGRSANPEFELLTSLSMRFLYEKSIPYIDYINRPYPSIVNEFKQNGYQTNAFHVDSLAFFNYKKVYPLIGFDHVETLRNIPGIELDPAGRFPSENALVDRIIEFTDKNEEPQFIFSFPNSTHGFWDYEAYLNSELEVLGRYGPEGNNYLKTYINAIHQADKAIGKLVNHFKAKNKPAVIMVLGDHQPGLPEFRYQFLQQYYKHHGKSLEGKSRRNLKQVFRREVKNSDPTVNLKSHQVPYFIWTQDLIALKKDTSMNFLSLYLAEIAGIQNSPLFQFLRNVAKQIGVLSKSNTIDQKYKSLVDDYQMIQYDIMSGEQYILELMK